MGNTASRSKVISRAYCSVACGWLRIVSGYNSKGGIRLAAILCVVGATTFTASCGAPQGSKQDGVTRINGVAEVLIPAQKEYTDDLQIKVTLPQKYIWDSESEGALRGAEFRPINYRTLEPTDGLSPDNVLGVPPRYTTDDEVLYGVVPRYFREEDNGIMKPYDPYEDIGEERFGLSYRPISVPGRPESLWKRIYLKPGVSGELFYIICIPPMGPGSIEPPDTCTMILKLVPRMMNGRMVGIEVSASVPVSRMKDWPLIEDAMIKLIEPNVEWIEGVQK